MAAGITHTIGVLVRGQNQLNKALIKAEGSLTHFRKSAQATAMRVNAIRTPPGIDMAKIREASGHLQGMGMKAIFAGGALALNLGIAIKHAGDFQMAMAEVSTLVDTAAIDMEALGRQVRGLSREFGEMPIDTAKALYTTISAGFGDSAQATILLRGAMKLAKGGLADLSVSIDGLTSILNSYGMTAEQTTYVSDRMFVAMKAGKTTIGELSSSLGTVTPIASAVGVSLDAVLASISALTLGGLATTEATTAVRGILTAVIKATPKAQKKAKELGVQFSTAAIRAMGFAGWLEHVKEKTGGSEEAIAALFGRVEAITGALALTGSQAGKFANILEQMTGAAGATEIAFDKVTKTFGFQWKKMRANIWLVFEAIGVSLLPVITQMAKGIGFVAEKISLFAEAHPFLTKIVTTLGLVTAAVLILGGVALIVGAQIMTAMAMVNISTGGILLIIGGIITGITVLIVGFTSLSASAAEEGSRTAKAFAWIKKAFYAMATPVAYGLGFLVGSFTKAWDTVAKDTSEMWPLISDIISASWGIIKMVLFPQMALLTAMWTTSWGVIKTVVVAVWSFIILTLKTAWSIIKNMTALGWNIISGIFKAGLLILTGDWAGAWEAIKTSAVAAWENIKGIFGAIINYFSGLTDIFIEAGKGIMMAFWEGIQAGWNVVKTGIEDTLGFMRSFFGESDAKRGPLSDITASGRSLMPTYARGIDQTAEEPAKAVSRALRPLILKPDLGGMAQPISSAATAPVNVDISPAISSAAGSRSISNTMVLESGAIVLQVTGETVVEDLEKQLEELLARMNAKFGQDQGAFSFS